MSSVDSGSLGKQTTGQSTSPGQALPLSIVGDILQHTVTLVSDAFLGSVLVWHFVESSPPVMER